jgi:D-alanine-D-alanine ligase-like ATP-grasp enzyme
MPNGPEQRVQRQAMQKKFQMERWQTYLPQLPELLAQINRVKIIAPGVVPFSRVVPGLFLDNYQIFCVKDCKDNDLIREFCSVFCVADKDAKLAQRIKGTGYLIKNHLFQSFLQRQTGPYTLLFYVLTEFIAEALDERKIPYLGNFPDSRKDVLTKTAFRALLKKLSLPHLNNVQLPKAEFFAQQYDELVARLGGPFVCQRGDYDAGGEVATFFITSPDALDYAKKLLEPDDRFSMVELNPYVRGNTYSMMGCATRHGTLTGPLQLQLIDLPESLRTRQPSGIFFGHDWSYTNWPAGTEEEAVRITETIGNYLYQECGYKGIFGIDFIHDEATGALYPLECNPRFTGSQPWVSLLAIDQGLPPMELFHIAEHLNLDYKLNFAELNAAYKYHPAFAQILVGTHGVTTMPVDLPIGVYSEEDGEVVYQSPKLFSWDLTSPKQFLVVDPIFKIGADIQEESLKLFKIVFPRPVAETSYKLKPEISTIAQAFSDLLHREVKNPPVE